MNSQVKSTHFNNAFGIPLRLYLKKQKNPPQNIFCKIKNILHLSLTSIRKKDGKTVLIKLDIGWIGNEQRPSLIFIVTVTHLLHIIINNHAVL